MKFTCQASIGALIAAAAMATLPALPAVAQSRAVPTYTVFGDEPCPRDYICVRLPANEKYRIPKDLRGETGLEAAQRWGDRVSALEYAGRSGTMSCSPSGPGGASGCFRELTQQARAEQRARGEKPAIPLDLP